MPAIEGRAVAGRRGATEEARRIRRRAEQSLVDSEVLLTEGLLCAEESRPPRSPDPAPVDGAGGP